MKKFFLLALLLTFTFPAYAATPKRVVYTIEHPTTLNNAPATHHQLRSVRVDGTDDRLLYEPTPLSGSLGITEYAMDDRIVVAQYVKGGPDHFVVRTADGKDVTNKYSEVDLKDSSYNSTGLESPDHQWVAFHTDTEASGSASVHEKETLPQHLHVVNRKTREVRDYTHPTFKIGFGQIYPLAWSSDSRTLYIQSGQFEGPTETQLWRITIADGTIYKYKSLKGIKTLELSVNPNATFALGKRFNPGGATSPFYSEIVRIDLKKDQTRVLLKSKTTVFSRPSFGQSNDIILFDEWPYSANVSVWDKMRIRQYNLRTGKSKYIGKKGARRDGPADGQWLVYKQFYNKKGDIKSGEFHLYDLVKGTDRVFTKESEKQRVRIVGIFSE